MFKFRIYWDLAIIKYIVRGLIFVCVKEKTHRVEGIQTRRHSMLVFAKFNLNLKITFVAVAVIECTHNEMCGDGLLSLLTSKPEYERNYVKRQMLR